MGGGGGAEGGCQRVPRAIRLLSLSWNVSHYLPLPGQPPPSAPKMAGFIPLVYNTYQRTFLWPNVLFFPCFYHPPLPAINETYSRKRLFQPSDPCDCKSTDNSSICLFCEKKSVAEAK